MNRENMHIGQKVRIPAKDIVRYESENPDDEFAPLKKVVTHQKEAILFVRELHNPQVAGVSYSMDTESSFGVLYEVLEPIE